MGGPKFAIIAVKDGNKTTIFSEPIFMVNQRTHHYQKNGCKVIRLSHMSMYVEYTDDSKRKFHFYPLIDRDTLEEELPFVDDCDSYVEKDLGEPSGVLAPLIEEAEKEEIRRATVEKGTISGWLAIQYRKGSEEGNEGFSIGGGASSWIFESILSLFFFDDCPWAKPTLEKAVVDQFILIGDCTQLGYFDKETVGVGVEVKTLVYGEKYKIVSANVRGCKNISDKVKESPGLVYAFIRFDSEGGIEGPDVYLVTGTELVKRWGTQKSIRFSVLQNAYADDPVGMQYIDMRKYNKNEVGEDIWSLAHEGPEMRYLLRSLNSLNMEVNGDNRITHNTNVKYVARWLASCCTPTKSLSEGKAHLTVKDEHGKVFTVAVVTVVPDRPYETNVAELMAYRKDREKFWNRCRFSVDGGESGHGPVMGGTVDAVVFTFIDSAWCLVINVSRQGSGDALVGFSVPWGILEKFLRTGLRDGAVNNAKWEGGDDLERSIRAGLTEVEELKSHLLRVLDPNFQTTDVDEQPIIAIEACPGFALGNCLKLKGRRRWINGNCYCDACGTRARDSRGTP